MYTKKERKPLSLRNKVTARSGISDASPRLNGKIPKKNCKMKSFLGRGRCFMHRMLFAFLSLKFCNPLLWKCSADPHCF